MSEFFRKYLYDKVGDFKVPVLKSRLFIGVLVLKVVAGFMFASDFLNDMFAPFVNYFVTSGFANPYAHFHAMGFDSAFPYPQVMLWVLAVPRVLFAPLLSADYHVVTLLHLFVLRLPLLAADIVILLVLARWLRDRQAEVLKYYWCSPILFYITYLHGQLDVIPVMLLFVALYLLFKERHSWSLGFLGLAIAAKTGMAVAYPFVLVYLALKRVPWRRWLLLAALPPIVFLLANINQFGVPGFHRMVLETQEQFKVFDFSYSLGSGLVIYFVPMAFFLLFARSLMFRTYNRDIFLMFLGFAFGILTLLIPPMPGWYYWIIPFFVYFVVKRGDSKPVFIALNVLYFAYFLVTRHSDYWHIFQPFHPLLSARLNAYSYLALNGWPADTLVNLVFTLLQSALLLNIIWIYRKGIESNIQYKITYQPYLIGLAGDSGSGKSTLSALLSDKFGAGNTLLVHGDDLHKWERGDENWKEFTHLDPRANKLHDEVRNVRKMRGGQRIFRRHYDHDTGRFTSENRLDPRKVVIFEGLHSLYLDNLREVYDLKVFMSPAEDLRTHWKVARDVRERGYSPEKAVEQMKKREADAVRYIQGQEQHADLVVQYLNSSAIEQLGDETAVVGLRLKLSFGNDVDVSPLLEALRAVESLIWEYSYDESRQTLVFDGDISADAIDRIAYRLIPDLWDTVNSQPKWSDGYNGLIQLFIGYYVFYRMKLEAYEREK